MRTKIILSLIFLLALLLRFWNLSSYPDAIDEDEMALGYNAYSLIHGGIDEWGHKFPIYFESGGDFKYGLYSYIDTIPVAIFGLNTASTRSVAALSGTLSVIVIYFLVFELSKNKNLSLISSFVLAVSPTFVHFSRVGYNNVLGVFLSLICLTFYLKWINTQNKKSFVFSLIFFILALYTYQAYRIFLPVSLLAISTGYFFSVNRALKIKLVLSGILFICFTVASFIPAASRTRSQDYSILVNTPKLTEEYNEDNQSGVKLLTTRIFHNKVVEIGIGVSERYFSYFDPTFLFVTTSGNTGRHTIPNVGFLYLIEAPLFLLGILYLFKHFKSTNAWIVVFLLLTAPLAASMVVEPRSTIRTIVMAVPMAMIISVGIYQLMSLKKIGKFIAIGLAILYLANVSYFLHQYFVHKEIHHPWYSDVGLKEMVKTVGNLQDNYSSVIMSNAHYMPYLFFNKVDPHDFVSKSDFFDNPPAGLVRVKRYGKIYFNMPYDCPPAGKIHVLYVCFGTKVPLMASIVDVIRYKDSLPAIFFVEFTGFQSKFNIPERLSLEGVDSRFPSGLLPDSYPLLWPSN